MILWLRLHPEKKALDWGFNDSNIFEISENVGGRYSLWSSVGMSIFIGLGKIIIKISSWGKDNG